MAMEQKGFSMVTSTIAKAKTATQMIIISFILIFLGIKGLSLSWAIPVLDIIAEYDIIYNITLFATLFTVFTGLTYIYSNRNTLKGFIQDE
jgi:phosphatidylglycerophosphate synthase